MHETLEEKIFRIRYTAHNGSSIPQHHSMRRVAFTPALLLSIVAIPVVLDFLLVHFNPLIIQLWQIIFDFWLSKLSLPGSVDTISFKLFGVDVPVAFPDVPADAPSGTMWWVSLVIGLIIFVGSFYFSKAYLPLAYFLRLVIFLIFTSHIFFAMHPDFEYDVSSLIAGNLFLSYKMLLLIPWIMALTYNIFDFSFIKKCAISCLVVGYLIIFLPFQYVMQVFIVNKMSLLYLPVLHLLFSSLVDILLFMALYSWGLSWKRRGYVAQR